MGICGIRVFLTKSYWCFIFHINCPVFWHCFLSQVIIKICLIERTCAVLHHCAHLLFWDTVSLHITYNFSHKHGPKDAFLRLMKMPPSWSFHNTREPCLTKSLGTVAHKELLWAALALITWVSGPRDLDPESFFPVTPKVLQFLWETWMVPERNSGIYWTYPKWW